MIKEIRLRNRKDVEKLNQVASKQPFSLHVSKGHLILDAKSLLALFALIGKKDVFLVAPDHIDYNKFFDLIKELSL